MTRAHVSIITSFHVVLLGHKLKSPSFLNTKCQGDSDSHHSRSFCSYFFFFFKQKRVRKQLHVIINCYAGFAQTSVTRRFHRLLPCRRTEPTDFQRIHGKVLRSTETVLSPRSELHISHHLARLIGGFWRKNLIPPRRR